MTNDCPDCHQPLVYDEYTDSMKCLFCGHRHNISKPANIIDMDLCYSEDDRVDYGEYVETW